MDIIVGKHLKQQVDLLIEKYSLVFNYLENLELFFTISEYEAYLTIFNNIDKETVFIDISDKITILFEIFPYMYMYIVIQEETNVASFELALCNSNLSTLKVIDRFKSKNIDILNSFEHEIVDRNFYMFEFDVTDLEKLNDAFSIISSIVLNIRKIGVDLDENKC